MYSHKTMLRALLPSLMIAALLTLAGGLAYSLGAPAWVAYATVVLAVLAVLPGYERWERRQHLR